MILILWCYLSHASNVVELNGLNLKEALEVSMLAQPIHDVIHYPLAPDPLSLTGDRDGCNVLSQQGSPYTLIQFYAPWCGFCKEFAPIFERAADKMIGKVRTRTSYR